MGEVREIGSKEVPSKNNEDSKKDKFLENANKYGVTKKTLFSIVSIIAAMLFIIVLSLTQAGFDVDAIRKVSFWIDFVLLAGICIYGMISGRQMGDDIARNNPKGSFRGTLKKYCSTYTGLETKQLLPYLSDWLLFFKKRKIRKKMESLLQDFGIYQFEVLDLDKVELCELKKPWKKIWTNTKNDGKFKDNATYFLSYTDEQIEVIRYCLEGKVKVGDLSESFFINALSQNTKDMWESASKSEKKKGYYMGLNYTYKIISLLLMCFITTGLEAGLSSGAGSQTMWVKLVSRLTQMVVSVAWGAFIAWEIVKIDTEYLNFKEAILKQYGDEISQKIFVPKTLEQRAKEAYAEAVKEDATNGEERSAGNNGATASSARIPITGASANAGQIYPIIEGSVKP